MPDVCDLVLDEHETFRRRFAELDERRGTDPATLRRLWEPLAVLLDRHADAEEHVLYPKLLRRGADGEDETQDAIGDHNRIRDAVRDAAGRQVGSEKWWQAVDRARTENSDHMAEEERGALADFRQHTDDERREQLGAAFVAFNRSHTEPSRVDTTDKDPDSYVDEHE